MAYPTVVHVHIEISQGLRPPPYRCRTVVSKSYVKTVYNKSVCRHPQISNFNQWHYTITTPGAWQFHVVKLTESSESDSRSRRFIARCLQMQNIANETTSLASPDVTLSEPTDMALWIGLCLFCRSLTGYRKNFPVDEVREIFPFGFCG